MRGDRLRKKSRGRFRPTPAFAKDAELARIEIEADLRVAQTIIVVIPEEILELVAEQHESAGSART